MNNELIKKDAEQKSIYRFSQKKHENHYTTVPVKEEIIGANKILLIAGPCAVESKNQIIDLAHELKQCGAVGLRGGAYKPRTSPYSFQGHEEKALEWLAQAREETGLAIVTEIMDPSLVSLVDNYADVLQIGSRNMQNFVLLKAVAKSKRPILLKRGMSSTIHEFLSAAEYVLSEGNSKVILCERGIRTFENATRNTFDINAIPVLKQQTHLPVLADPSHGTGNSKYVAAVSQAAIAAGADGLLIEVHATPDTALSDGDQSITPQSFKSLTTNLEKIAKAIGRTIL